MQYMIIGRNTLSNGMNGSEVNISTTLSKRSFMIIVWASDWSVPSSPTRLARADIWIISNFLWSSSMNSSEFSPENLLAINNIKTLYFS